MRFPAGKRNAVDLIKAYEGGQVSRELVEAVIDLNISLEPDEMGMNGGNRDKYRHELFKGMEIIQAFGKQVQPQTVEALQDAFYSFTNSNKYRFSAVTISVARETLNAGFDGLFGWLA